jgi:hypothetical protein
LHRFRNAAADRFTRRFYPPPLWKVNVAVMFWKAAKRERCESGDEHFGVGAISCVFGAARVAWRSCRAIASTAVNVPAPRCWPTRHLAPTSQRRVL